MDSNTKLEHLFEEAHLMILVCYTIFSVILIGEALLLGWEGWFLILIAVGVIASWTIHLMQLFSSGARLWIYSMLMMVAAFFYGIHQTSTYDLGLVVCCLLMIFTMTGKEVLITLWQAVYYLAFLYDLVSMAQAGQLFDRFTVSRTVFHLGMIAVVGFIARKIIKRWLQVLSESQEEILFLRKMSQMLNDFLANISHEIRTPINAVVNLTGVCIDKEENEEIKRDLHTVYDAGKRVGSQISDILDYSEIDMGTLAVNSEDYMISSLLMDMVAEINAQNYGEIELVINVDPAIPSVMNTDVSKLKKILKHLIDNSLKYTKEGGVYVHITSRKRDYGINLCIEVRDTGIGTSEHEMEMVFNRFYQADSGRTRSTNGLGLGLSIVNGFVQALHGFLTMESEPGKGTTIRVSLPQKVIDEESCMGVQNAAELVLGAYLHFDKFENPNVREFYHSMVKDLAHGLHVTLHQADDMNGLKELAKEMQFTHIFVGQEEYEEDSRFLESIAKEVIVTVVADESFVPAESARARVIRKPFYSFPIISVLNSNIDEQEKEEGKIFFEGVKALVVDDEPMNHMVAKEILKQYGMQVYTAASGQESIDFCKDTDVDIVFMDHMMPEMDGIEAMKRLRRDFSRAGKETPIVALTANAVSTAKEMFLKEGFDGFISKPIELTEFERVVKKVLPKSMITIRQLDKKDTKDQGIDQGINQGIDQEIDQGNDIDEWQWLKELGVDTARGLAYCQNDSEFYKTLLMQYASDAQAKRKNADSFLKDEDYKNYEIIVHAIKSTSKMIGAMDLSEAARGLEEAAENSDGGRINQTHQKTMDEYRILTERILRNSSGGQAQLEPEGEVVMEFDAEPEREVVMEFDAEPEGEIVMEFDAEPEGEMVMEFAAEEGDAL